MGADSASVFISPNKIDYLVTDDNANEATVEACKKKGMNVLISD